MTPAPTLQELIETVERDSPSADMLDLLATASSTVAQLEEVGDAVLGHFVDRCRRSGHFFCALLCSRRSRPGDDRLHAFHQG